MTTLGRELRRLRSLKRWTLRDVEKKTGKKISNAYLCELESERVETPSPRVLHLLSVVYDASYPALMKLAGFVDPSSSPEASSTSASIGFDALDLTEEERDKLLDFLAFLRRKKK